MTRRDIQKSLPTILIADDETEMIDMLKRIISDNYKVIIATDTETAIEKAYQELPDLIILDVMFPTIGGIAVCNILKKDPRTRAIPIIMLSCRSADIDKIKGLDCGADDYIAKPFDPGELMARIKAMFRRISISEEAEDVLVSGSIVLDPERMVVEIDNRLVDFSNKEFRILKFLMKNRSKIIEREKVIVMPGEKIRSFLQGHSTHI
ncbi:MAG: response regulator [Elusimicrobiota bacterium]